MANKPQYLYLLILLLFCKTTECKGNNKLTLRRDQVNLVVPTNMSGPVKEAVKAISNDFVKTMGFKPTQSVTRQKKVVNVVVAEGSAPRLRPVIGFESHRVYVDGNTIYILGNDMRGTIYALYTFSEKILGVPPLWYFTQWQPVPVATINVNADLDLVFGEPQVRYRAWFPNDTDLFTPWRSKSDDNNERWIETMLRLKLNTVELEATIDYKRHGLSDEARLMKKYGLIITSHHHVALNNNFKNWEGYWREVRRMEPPKLLLSNEAALKEFWRYSAETVVRSGQENLWQLAFRGVGDQPFWAAFSDAPAGEQERADVISRMLRIQLDIVREVTGENSPFVRMTFYDELSSMLSRRILDPPSGKNILWTFVATRRDHYPPVELAAQTREKDVSLGYYMNLQFTSTGSHLAPGEGPWKMEENYRFVSRHGRLLFSVVNAGNLREFLMELSANARMMWNFDSFTADDFLLKFCVQYFGKTYADRIARLYRNYYDSYWQQRPSDSGGIGRQYIFHDLRMQRAFEQVARQFNTYLDHPFTDIGFESVPGRTFGIAGSHPVDSLIAAMPHAANRFLDVARECSELQDKLPPAEGQLLYDQLGAYALYMGHLSQSLAHFMTAYKHPACRTEQLKLSLNEMRLAAEALWKTAHGIFDTWYDGDRLFNLRRNLHRIEQLLQDSNNEHNPISTTNN